MLICHLPSQNHLLIWKQFIIACNQQEHQQEHQILPASLLNIKVSGSGTALPGVGRYYWWCTRTAACLLPPCCEARKSTPRQPSKVWYKWGKNPGISEYVYMSGCFGQKLLVLGAGSCRSNHLHHCCMSSSGLERAGSGLCCPTHTAMLFFQPFRLCEGKGQRGYFVCLVLLLKASYIF